MGITHVRESERPKENLMVRDGQKQWSHPQEAPPPERIPPQYQHHLEGKGRLTNQSLFNRLMVALLPLAPKPLVKKFAQRYVAGETVEEMLQTVEALNEQGISATVDVLGEFIHNAGDAYETAATYQLILDEIDRRGLDANISVKLTALGLLLDEALCLELMQNLVAHAAQKNNFVRIDMEDSGCTEKTIQLYLALRQTHTNVGIVMQAYLRRTHDDVIRIIEAGAGHFRICKGIYVEPRWLAYQHPDLINQNYAAILREMLTRGAYVGIATHDERLVWNALKQVRELSLGRYQYEFQMLLGVDHELRDMLVAAGHHMRVYVPFGKQWHAYCMRRLKENPKIAGYILGNLFKR